MSILKFPMGFGGAGGAGANAVYIDFPEVILFDDAPIGSTVGFATVNGTYTGTPIFAIADSGGDFTIDYETGRVTTAQALTHGENSFTISVTGITPVPADATVSFEVNIVGENDDTVGDGGVDEIQVTAVSVGGSIILHGRVKPGFSGKLIYPIDMLQPGLSLSVNYHSDFSHLLLGGDKAGVGFGFITGNSFHLVGIQGDGASGTDVFQVYGSPPNGWNKNIGHTKNNNGAPISGSQYYADVQFEVNGTGNSYTYRTSDNSQGSWHDELVDQSLTPFSTTTDVAQFGVAVWFSNDDTGPFTIDISWGVAVNAGLETITAQHWRLRITAWNSFPSISGLEFAKLGEEMPSIPTASASSTNAGAPNGADGAFDGNVANWWGPTTAVESWIAGDFGAPIEVNVARFMGRNGTIQYPTAAVVEYSDNGMDWTSARTVSGLVAAPNAGFFDKSVSGRWFKQIPLDVVPADSKCLWRLRITAFNLSASIAKLEFRESLGGPQILASPPKAHDPSPLNYGTMPPESALDGSASTFWAGNSSPNGIIFEMDNRSVDVAQISITVRNDGGDNFQVPETFSLDWSDDGVTWTTVQTWSPGQTWTAGETKTFDV